MFPFVTKRAMDKFTEAQRQVTSKAGHEEGDCFQTLNRVEGLRISR